MALNSNRGHSKGAGKAAQNGPETVSESALEAASQSETPGAPPVVLPPPAPEKSNRLENLTSGTPGSAAAASDGSLLGSSTRAARKHRGRRRIRERWQVRARLDELAGKLERGEIDAKTAAIMVQSLNAILSCLNSEKAEDVDKRLAALEERVPSNPSRKGASA